MTHRHPTRKNHHNLSPIKHCARLSAGRSDPELVKEVLAIKEADRLRREGWVDGVRVRPAPTVTVLPRDARPTLFERVCSAVDREAQRLPIGLQS